MLSMILLFEIAAVVVLNYCKLDFSSFVWTVIMVCVYHTTSTQNDSLHFFSQVKPPGRMLNPEETATPFNSGSRTKVSQMLLPV